MYKQGNARGTSEVRRGTSSIHFHRPVPRSSSHIGHGFLLTRERKKTHKQKTHKQKFHGIVPGFGGGGILFMCFSPPKEWPEKKIKKNTHTQTNFRHPPSPGTIPQICLCLCVLSFPDIQLRSFYLRFVFFTYSFCCTHHLSFAKSRAESKLNTKATPFHPEMCLFSAENHVKRPFGGPISVFSPEFLATERSME